MKKTRLSLLIIASFLAISSCSGASYSDEETPKGVDYLEALAEGETEVHEGDFEPLDLGEVEDVPITNGDAERWTYKDVDPNFVLYLQYDKDLLTYPQVPNYVTITSNATEDVINFTLEQPSGAEFVGIDNVLALAPETPYQKGAGYTVSLKKDAPVSFYQRNSDIRKVVFTVKDSEHENINLILDFPTYDLNKVLTDTGSGVIKPCLTYNGVIKENKDEIIRFVIDPDNKLLDTLYVKIVSKSVSNNVTTLYYAAPDLDKVVKDCDAHYEDHGLDLEHNYTAPNAENIREDIVNSEPVLVTMAAIAHQYGFADSAGLVDFLKSLKVNVTFKGQGSTIHILINLTGIHKFTTGKLANWVLKVQLAFEYHKTYNVSCDVNVKKALGIPYGVDVSFGCSEDETCSVILKINLVSKIFDIDVDVDKPPEAEDFDEAKRIIDNLKDQWQDHGVKDAAKTSIDGSTLSLRLGWIRFYLGWVTIEIDVYLCITIEFSGNFLFAWNKTTHTDIVSYNSNGGGSSDAGSSSTQKKMQSINVDLFVKLNIEFFGRVEVYVYLTGLKWLVNLELSIDIGVYLTVIGLGEFDWNITEGKVSGSLGFSFEFGFFFRITLSVNLLSIWSYNLDLLNKRFPLFKIDTLEDIKSHVDGTIDE